MDISTFREVFTAYETTVLRDDEAEVAAVHSWLVRHHEVLEPGDTVVVAYSGHGAQRRDPNTQEPDGKSESLVLYDRHYRDHDLSSALHGFRPGVRVVALVDACHAAGLTYLDTPKPVVERIVYRRGRPVPGCQSMTIAAAPERANALQRADEGGLLTDCLSRAWTGAADDTWGALWDRIAGWSLALNYMPKPQAWLDGPDDDDSILQAATTQ